MGHRLVLIIAIIIGLSLFAAGCRTSKEPDQTAFITAIGIDKAEQGKIKVTYQIIIPRAVGGAQGAVQDIQGGPVMTTSIVASNTAEAHNLLGTTLSRYTNLTHLKALFIGEDVARDGIGDIIASFVRYREYRGTVFIDIVRGKASEYFAKNKPKLDYLPSKWNETIMSTADESSYYTSMNLHGFYVRLNDPGSSPYANYVGLNPLTGADIPNEATLPYDKADGYLPGNIPRPNSGAGEQPEFAGIAVFAGDKMVGALDTKETRILAILQDKFPRGFFVIADPLAPDKTINLDMRNGNKPDISVHLINGREVIKIRVLLEAEIISIQSGITYEGTENQKGLENVAASIVRQQIEDFIHHTQDLGSDVFGFGYYLRPELSNYQELSRLNLAELYKTAETNVEVTVKIRRTGLMWRTSFAK